MVQPKHSSVKTAINTLPRDISLATRNFPFTVIQPPMSPLVFYFFDCKFFLIANLFPSGICLLEPNPDFLRALLYHWLKSHFSYEVMLSCNFLLLIEGMKSNSVLYRIFLPFVVLLFPTCFWLFWDVMGLRAGCDRLVREFGGGKLNAAMGRSSFISNFAPFFFPSRCGCPQWMRS